MSSSSAKVQPGTVMLVSSANIFAQDTSRQLGRSIIYVRQSKGSSILPRGTPQVNLLALDNAPLTMHFWDLLHHDKPSKTQKIVEHFEQHHSSHVSAKLFHDQLYQRLFKDQ